MKQLYKLTNLFICILFASCSMERKYVSSDTMGIIKADVITKPQLAEIEIESRKIEGSARVKKKDYFPNPKEACINLALRNATEKGKCDVLVQPMYEIEETGRYIEVKVSGFAGSYKNFRDLKETDTSTFIAYGKISKVIKNDIAAPKTVTKDTQNIGKTKKGGFGNVLLTVLGVGLLLTVISSL